MKDMNSNWKIGNRPFQAWRKKNGKILHCACCSMFRIKLATFLFFAAAGIFISCRLSILIFLLVWEFSFLEDENHCPDLISMPRECVGWSSILTYPRLCHSRRIVLLSRLSRLHRQYEQQIVTDANLILDPVAKWRFVFLIAIWFFGRSCGDDRDHCLKIRPSLQRVAKGWWDWWEACWKHYCRQKRLLFRVLLYSVYLSFSFRITWTLDGTNKFWLHGLFFSPYSRNPGMKICLWPYSIGIKTYATPICNFKHLLKCWYLVLI